MWRLLCTFLLLMVLLFVALEAWLTQARSTSWERPLQVAVYPIKGDESEAAERFVTARGRRDLTDVEKFFAEEARRYNVALQQPLELEWTAPLSERPPPLAERAGTLSVLFWSLRMRYWAWRAPQLHSLTDIKLFVLYHDSARTPRLRHSVGMRKGLYAVVNVFADEGMEGSNHVVLAHELLHTLGAKDLYDPRTNQPLHPIGFAEPDRKPLFPQRYAEIMGGRIPVSPADSVMPQSLSEVVVGRETAALIRWVR